MQTNVGTLDQVFRIALGLSLLAVLLGLAIVATKLMVAWVTLD